MVELAEQRPEFTIEKEYGAIPASEQ